ncbi:EpsG family protein [Aeromonas allosaccharophila]|uniref:EpsG family protein n=1 Tax=Aeromonas allosaccharophila TaxID=656 RepID=UPI0038D19D3B
MIDYFIFYLFIVVITAFTLIEKVRNIAHIFIFIFVLYFIGARPVTLGTDTKSYYDIYNSWAFGVWDSDLEFLFSIVTSLFNYFNIDSYYWIVTLSFVYLLFIFLSIHKIYKNDSIVLMLIFSNLYFWLYGINIIRYGLAFSIILFSSTIYACRMKKTKGFYLFTLSSIGFHISIICQALFLFFYNRFIVNFLFRFYLVIIIASITFYAINIDLLEILIYFFHFFKDYFPERLVSRFFFYMYTYDAKEINLGFSYLMTTLAVFFSAVFRYRIMSNVDRSRYVFFELSFYFSMLNIMFMPFFYKYDTFSRVFTGFEFFSLFLIYELICCFFKIKLERFIILILFSLIMFSKVVYTGFLHGFLSDRF